MRGRVQQGVPPRNLRKFVKIRKFVILVDFLMYLGIEGGGTTWVVVLASNSTTFEKREDFSTF